MMRRIFSRLWSREAPPLVFTRVNKNSKLPIRQEPNGHTMKLCACENSIISVRGSVQVNTGLKCEVPAGFYLRIDTPPELASLGRGKTESTTIPEGCSEEVKVEVKNLSDDNIKIKVGDPIAQLSLVYTVNVDTKPGKAEGDMSVSYAPESFAKQGSLRHRLNTDSSASNYVLLLVGAIGTIAGCFEHTDATKSRLQILVMILCILCTVLIILSFL